MKTDAARNGGLALIGLAALTIYILACTSFSPDDKKVLYPAFDLQTGGLGAAVYDRKSARSHMVFVPLAYAETNMTSALLRPQWLDNNRILVTWCQGDKEGVDLAIIPVKGESAVRLFRLPEVADATVSLMFPLAIAGQSAFVIDSKVLFKLNLVNGQIVRHDLPTDESGLYLYSGTDGQSLFYLSEESEDQKAFGRLNPANFDRTPIITFTNKLADGTFFAFDERGRRIALVEESDEGQNMVLMEVGQAPVRRQLPAGQERQYGNAVFVSRRNLLVAGYMREGTNTASFGLLEIPLGQGAIRDTVLIKDAAVEKDMAPVYFQIGISHDGRTAAVSSAYLACDNDDFEPNDCALFLVDLTDAKRKVTKVPIPMPAHRPAIPAIK